KRSESATRRIGVSRSCCPRPGDDPCPSFHRATASDGYRPGAEAWACRQNIWLLPDNSLSHRWGSTTKFAPLRTGGATTLTTDNFGLRYNSDRMLSRYFLPAPNPS